MYWLYRIMIILGFGTQLAFGQDSTIIADDGLNQNINYTAAEVPPACISLPAADAYGLIPDDDQTHPDKIFYCFPGQAGNVVLFFQVYDTDFIEEVDLYLNGIKILNVPVSGDNNWSGDLNVLLSDALVNDTGANEVVFDNTQNPPNANWWGVRQVSVLSCFPMPSAAAYGNIPDGDQSHADKVAYYFLASAGDAYLVYQAYDISGVDEVDIFLNGVKVQDVPPTAENQWSGTRGVFLPDELVNNTSLNVVVFDNTKNPPGSVLWGVRQVTALTCFRLSATAVTTALGKLHNGDQSRPDKVAYWFPGQAGDLYLLYQAYDIDDPNELDVFLNGVKILDAPPTENNKWSSYRGALLPDSLIQDTGANVVIFDNTKNPPDSDWWGVKQVSIENYITLPAAAAYGKIPGGDQSHVDKVIYFFAGQTGSPSLSFQVYDIGQNTEADVILNGVKIHDVAITFDNEWSPGRTIVLPDTLVHDAATNVLIFDNTKNPPNAGFWGVREVSLTATAEVPPACISLPAADAYGLIPDGDQTHPDKIFYCFPGQAGNAVLSFQVYDTDFLNEVDLYLNGVKIFDVPVSGDNHWSGDLNVLLSDALVNDTGANEVVFDNTKNPPEAHWWGVRQVSIVSGFPLPAAAAYGNIPDGDQSHADKVAYYFPARGGNAYLSYQAYHISGEDKVDVFLNGVKVQDVPPTATNQWSGTRGIFLPDGLVSNTGVNVVVFDNTKNPPGSFSWGVREVTVQTCFRLSATAVKTALGKIQGKDQSHPDKVTYWFPGQLGDLYLLYQAYDIDDPNELDVLLNGVKILDAPPTGNNQWSGYRDVLLPDSLIQDTGANIIIFDNTKNPPDSDWWGVQQVSVENYITLPAAAAYGKIPGGDQSHVDKVIYFFAGQAGSPSLSFQVYDIEQNTEADVILNGVKIHDVAITFDNEWSPTRTIVLPDTLVHDAATNVLIFDNTMHPSKTLIWGVREVSFTAATEVPPACISLPAAEDYGLIPNGDQTHPDKIFYCFPGQAGNVVLSFQVYDTDFLDEVDLYLNGVKIFDVPATGDNLWSGDLNVLLSDALVNDTETNEVVFDNTKNPPNANWWGVRQVSIVSSFPLPVAAAYGNIPGGDQSHSDKVAYYFPARTGDAYLSYQAYDISGLNEVDVFLNGVKVQDVPGTAKDKWSGTRGIFLPDGLINNTGVNVVVFDNTKNPPDSVLWGVREVTVQTCFRLTKTAALGKIQHGDQSHPDKVAYWFPGQAGDLYLFYQVYDIDGPNELDVYLNGAKILDAPPTENNKWSGYLGMFVPDSLIQDTGANVLIFDNTKNPPKSDWWGVKRVSVEKYLTLPAAAAYGKIPGGDQSHADKVVYFFAGQAAAPTLSFQIYDIEFIEEIDILLNGVKIHDVAVTFDNEWSPTRTILLPDTLVHDAATNVLIFDNTMNPPSPAFWGVREVSVSSALSRQTALDNAATTSNILPAEFQLAQNYPNPFNPTTQIHYELPKVGHVSLVIYNSLGQEVRRLVEQQQPAGYHHVTWNGRDQNGKPAPSGIYHYRLQVKDAASRDDYVATKKMLMAK